MEYVIPVFLSLIIFVLPVVAMKYHRYRKDKKWLRKLDMRVKDELISSTSRGAIDPMVMAMVKGHIVKTRLLWCGIALAIFGFAALIWDFLLILGAVPICGVVTADMLYRLFGLRDVSTLMKVKAFVFRTRSSDAAAVYYDMQRLGYRTFAQSTMFVSGTKAEAGRYVYLIVRRSEKSYHPVMILDF